MPPNPPARIRRHHNQGGGSKRYEIDQASIGGGADAAVTGDVNWLLIAGVIVAAVAVAVILVSKARHNRERANAYLRVASE